jgi:hypothetical protein
VRGSFSVLFYALCTFVPLLFNASTQNSKSKTQNPLPPIVNILSHSSGRQSAQTDRWGDCQWRCHRPREPICNDDLQRRGSAVCQEGHPVAADISPLIQFSGLKFPVSAFSLFRFCFVPALKDRSHPANRFCRELEIRQRKFASTQNQKLKTQNLFNHSSP